MRARLALSVTLLGVAALVSACSGNAANTAVTTPAPSPTATSPSRSPEPSASSSPTPSPEPSSILAVLCDSATEKQVAILEAAMRPGYTVTKVIDVRTREGGEHALLGVVEGPGVSGMARWIGSTMKLTDLQSADQAAADSSTAPIMTAPPDEAIDYLNQTGTCFDAIHK